MLYNSVSKIVIMTITAIKIKAFAAAFQAFVLESELSS